MAIARGTKRAEITSSPSKPHSPSPKKSKVSTAGDGDVPCFSGSPVPSDEAEARWPNRYISKNMTEKLSVTLPDDSTEEKEFIQARRHYTKSIVDGVVFNLSDDAYIQASEGEPNFIAKIVEMFEAVSEETYICTQWFYRANDTVIQHQDNLIDERRVFYSDTRDDNPLSCIVSKVTINQLLPSMDDAAKEKAKGSCDLYVDMKPQQKMSTLLDLYSGCGAMSSGLSIGASLGEEIIVKVRNENAENFFNLLKEWEKLCKDFGLVRSKEVDIEAHDTDSDKSEIEDGLAVPSGQREVEKLLDICYIRNPKDTKSGKRGLHFKVCRKGAKDSWEPVHILSKEKIKEFVSNGHKSQILPLLGDVDFLCGGPPCQGISGHNRFRKVSPLTDEKNHQLVVFMDIVEFLKPRYVLMENVTDILKFAQGELARYAVGRLVAMDYQARLGIMAAGSYGIPQCRMRFFLWGAGPTERLPQFPLPTHEYLKKGVVINEFKEILVGHGNPHLELHKPVLLWEVISDLPMVENSAVKDEMPYDKHPKTEFQELIRMKRKYIFPDSERSDSNKSILYDHLPFNLSADDYERGANFRDLPGLIVDSKNVVRLDRSVERPLCESMKPLVPTYALKFESGKSSKPFGRLWKDDIVATVVTRPEPHNQVILHPFQNRVLTPRENARLQGFPDCYKLDGPVKQRYMQVGNAVSFSVSIPLGYCLAEAMQGKSNALPLRLPFKFPDCLRLLKSDGHESKEFNSRQML